MKKMSAIVSLLLYLTATSGMVVDSFYCCGKLASGEIQLVAKEPVPAGQSGSRHCCDHVTRFFKVHDAQQPSVSNISFHAPVIQLPAVLPALSFLFNTDSQGQAHLPFLFYPPPLPGAIAAYVRNCTFLI